MWKYFGYYLIWCAITGFAIIYVGTTVNIGDIGIELLLMLSNLLGLYAIIPKDG